MTGKMIREARQLAFDELFRLPQVESSHAIDESFPEEFTDDELKRNYRYNIKNR
jgi:hypothetical protein